jgi:hypothetical protein
MKQFKEYLQEKKYTVDEIIKLIKKDNKFIFSSFNDKKIQKVEDYLEKNNIDYITTSQTGNDYIIATKGSHWYDKKKK